MGGRLMKAKKNRKPFKIGDFTMDFVIYTLLIILTVITLYPVWYVIVCSFATSTEVARQGSLMIWPRDIDFGAYKLVFEDKNIIRGLRNSLLIEVLALPINLTLTLMGGYFLACTNMLWKKPIVNFLILTMFINGGMIPSYLNIRELGLYDTIWALISPTAVNLSRCIIVKTSIEAIPDSLRESAYLDGASDMQIIFRIVMPLIKATLAVMALYYGVGHWNAWFNASIYLEGNELMPLQNVLRSILIANKNDDMNPGEFNAYAETIRYAAIVVSTAPIMCIYPFLQKYFAKGALIGAVKG